MPTITTLSWRVMDARSALCVKSSSRRGCSTTIGTQRAGSTPGRSAAATARSGAIPSGWKDSTASGAQRPGTNPSSIV
jgi:hypothetical protein